MLVIVAAGMVVLVAAVGLVIDGGYLWARERDTQNGTDASAEAGAVQLVRVLRGDITVAAGGPAVCDAVEEQAATNGIEVTEAYYTDLAGNRLGIAIDSSGGCNPIPPCTPPTCAGDFASGVEVLGHSTTETFLMRIIGFTEMGIDTTATAIGGYVLNPCESEEGCTLLPISPSVTVTVCDNTNNSVSVDEDGEPGPDLYKVQDPPVIITIPFCKTASGSIGWLDWDGGGGGASEIEGEIRNPTGVWPGPGWYQIAQTGDVNSGPVETAINERTNEVVYIPMFDDVCSHNPDPDPCPADDHAGGSDIWYHLPQLASFRLLDPHDPDGVPARSAWITGNSLEIKAVCGEVSESGATSCITGAFVDIITEGPVGALPSGQLTSTFYGVQLIK